MRLRISIAALLFSGLYTLCLAVSAVQAQRASKREADEEEKFVQQVVELTNRARAKAGVPPLKLQETLCTAARWMAQDMATQDYFDHTDHQGRKITERFRDFGYRGYHYIGENIAAGQQTPEQVVTEWLNSPGHRHNLLSPNFSEIGIGYVFQRDSRLRRYWVQDFGARFDVYPVVINSGAAQTRNNIVKLYLYGEEWADRMRLSNDGIHWNDWQPFRTNYDWRIEMGNGRRTVYVELSNQEETRRANASILLIQEQVIQNDLPSRSK